MAIRKILTNNDPTLRKVCRPVKDFNKRLGVILDDMLETMYKADGVGLAGPQVGITRRIAVVDVGEGPIELVNPVIVSSSGSQTGEEGCLSLPGRRAIVTRPNEVMVRAQNRNGETFELTGTELLARALCHEIGHLDGQLYIDIMDEEIFQEEE